MRFLHIADLHIGKIVNGFSLLEDQRFALENVLQLAASHEADALLLAGDLYDKTAPSAEAVALLDWFLTQTAEADLPCFAIPGNHDSAERVGYAARLLQRQGVYVPSAFTGKVEHFALEDEHGPVNVWLLPFLKPVHVRAAFPEHADEIGQDYTAALRCVLEACEIDSAQRNILLAHQFVTWGGVEPERTDSELSLGGLDNVDASVFDAFDYAALGHVHRPQRIGRDEVRYAGSLLKYSFSEIRYPKSAVLINMGPKGQVDIELLPLPALRDMREIKGPLSELLSEEVASAGNPLDYLHVVLTDEEPIIDAISRIRAVYPNVMALDYENRRTQAASSLDSPEENDADLTPFELFARFFEQQNGIVMSASQEERVRAVLESSLEGDQLYEVKGKTVSNSIF